MPRLGCYACTGSAGQLGHRDAYLKCTRIASVLHNKGGSVSGRIHVRAFVALVVFVSSSAVQAQHMGNVEGTAGD